MNNHARKCIVKYTDDSFIDYVKLIGCAVLVLPLLYFIIVVALSM